MKFTFQKCIYTIEARITIGIIFKEIFSKFQIGNTFKHNYTYWKVHLA